MTEVTITPSLWRSSVTHEALMRFSRNSVRYIWLRQVMFLGAAISTAVLLGSFAPFMCYLLCLGAEIHDLVLARRTLGKQGVPEAVELVREEQSRVLNGMLSSVCILVFAGVVISLDQGGLYFLPFFYLFSAALYAAIFNHMMPRVLVTRIALYLAGFLGMGCWVIVMADPAERLEVFVQWGALSSGGFFVAWIAHAAIANEEERILHANDLMAREARFEDFASTASDMLFETDARLVVTWWSPDLQAFASERGLQREGLEASVLFMEFEAGARDLLDALRSRDAFRNVSVCLTHSKTGNTARMLVSGRPVKGQQGVHAGWRCAMRDVTDVMSSNAQVAELSGQLHQSEKWRSLGELTGGMAHTFNNTLSVVQGNLELALQSGARKDGEALDEMTQQLIAEAHGATIRAGTITRDLMALGGRAELEPVKTDIVGITRDVVRMLRRSFSASIDIVTDIDPSLEQGAFVMVDRAMLEHAILNLALNARDAIADTGTITFGIKGRRPDLSNRPDSLSIEISDTGCGMDPDTLARASEPYFTTKKFKRGAGIGLSVVLGFIDQSGGNIRIDSSPGKGTCVTLCFDRLLVSDPVSDTPKADMETGNGQSLLVVEDEPQVLRVTRLMLERLGYRVITAETGAEAWDRLCAGLQVDAVLTDLDMPGGMSGHDLAEALDSEQPDLPVMIMSGYDLSDARRDGWQGKRMWLQKPVKLAMLSENVRVLLDDTVRFPVPEDA